MEGVSDAPHGPEATDDAPGPGAETAGDAPGGGSGDAPAASATGTPSATRRRTLPIAVAAVAGLAAIVLGLTQPGTSESPHRTGGPSASATRAAPAPSATAPQDWMSEQHARRAADDALAKGRADAPIAMVIWSDFRCPFCRTWEETTAPALQKYVDDGTLRVEWRDFPALGDESVLAARAARAAAQQGKFWEFHGRLFQLPQGRGKVTEQAMVAIARDLGLDEARFTAAMRSEQVAQAVTKDATEGSRIGVNGTPSFLVGDAVIVGAQPTESFVSAIEQAVTLAQ